MNITLKPPVYDEEHPWRSLFRGFKLHDHQIYGAAAIVEFFGSDSIQSYANKIAHTPNMRDNIIEYIGDRDITFNSLVVNYGQGSGKICSIIIAAQFISPNNFTIFTKISTMKKWVNVLKQLGLTATVHNRIREINVGKGIFIFPAKTPESLIKTITPLVVMSGKRIPPYVGYPPYTDTKVISLDCHGVSCVFPNVLSLEYGISDQSLTSLIPFNIVKQEYNFDGLSLEYARQMDLELSDSLLNQYYNGTSIKSDIATELLGILSLMKEYTYTGPERYPDIPTGRNIGKLWKYYHMFRSETIQNRVYFAWKNMDRYYDLFQKVLQLPEIDESINDRILKLLHILKENKKNTVVVICASVECVAAILDVEEIRYKSHKYSKFILSPQKDLTILDKNNIDIMDLSDVSVIIKYGYFNKTDLIQLYYGINKIGRTTDCTIHYIN